MTQPRHLHFVFDPLLASCFVAAVLMAVPGTGRAEEATPTATGSSGGSSGFGATAGPFGEARQWVFSISSEGEFPFRLSKTGDDDWGLAFRPAADTFIIRNVSVGGTVTLSSGGGSNDVGIGARAGYNAALTGSVSVWIRGGLYFHRLAIDNGPTIHETALDITVPFLFHVVPHFLMGVGPFLHQPLQNDAAMPNTSATFGLTALVGGWF